MSVIIICLALELSGNLFRDPCLSRDISKKFIRTDEFKCNKIKFFDREEIL